MHRLASVVWLGAFGCYVSGAIFFFSQERWAREASRVDLGASRELLHPDGTLGIVRSAFQARDFSDSVRPHLDRALRQAPFYYQSSFLVAAFHANRLENAELTRRAFETSLRQYPANGRLHLTFAQWLFELARRRRESSEPLRSTALEHVGVALHLEPELAAGGLGLLRDYGVPVERWAELVPETQAARKQLLRALDLSGRREPARALLLDMARREDAGPFLPDAASVALRWKDPALLLEIVELWRRRASREMDELSRWTLFAARAHLDLGQPDAAFDVFRASLSEMESHSTSKSSQTELLNGMASQFLNRGQAVMAQSLFVRALSLDPRNTDASLGLARAYRRGGDRAAAMAQYRKTLELQPEHEAASRELDQLVAQELRR